MANVDRTPGVSDCLSERDFFVYYNRADRGWAEWIAWQLEDAGYTTVLQAWDFVPGANFVVEMDRAAQRSKRTIAVLYRPVTSLPRSRSRSGEMHSRPTRPA